MRAWEEELIRVCTKHWVITLTSAGHSSDMVWKNVISHKMFGHAGSTLFLVLQLKKSKVSATMSQNTPSNTWTVHPHSQQSFLHPHENAKMERVRVLSHGLLSEHQLPLYSRILFPDGSEIGTPTEPPPPTTAHTDLLPKEGTFM